MYDFSSISKTPIVVALLIIFIVTFVVWVYFGKNVKTAVKDTIIVPIDNEIDTDHSPILEPEIEDNRQTQPPRPAPRPYLINNEFRVHPGPTSPTPTMTTDEPASANEIPRKSKVMEHHQHRDHENSDAEKHKRRQEYARRQQIEEEEARTQQQHNEAKRREETAAAHRRHEEARLRNEHEERLRKEHEARIEETNRRRNDEAAVAEKRRRDEDDRRSNLTTTAAPLSPKSTNSNDTRGPRPTINHGKRQFGPAMPQESETISNLSPERLLSYDFNQPRPYKTPAVDSYLNLARARRYVHEYTHMPKKLKEYNIADKNLSIFPKWDTDSSDLTAICNVMLEALRFVHTSSARANHKDEISVVMATVDDFIGRLLQRATTVAITKDTYRFGLWGTNWYVFAVIVTSMLAHYLLLDRPLLDKAGVATLVLKIIQSPLRVFDRARDGYESRLLGPWLLAHHTKGTLASAIVNADYLTARDRVMAHIQYDTNATGLHMDMSWMAYDLLPAYDNLRDAVSERVYYYFYMDESLFMMPTINVAYRLSMQIVCHPSLEMGNFGLFGRKRSLYCPIDFNSKVGIAVQPLSRYIHYNTDDSVFTIRAQSMHMAYAQLDEDTKQMGKFWIQYRNVLYDDAIATKDKALRYPAPGLVSLFGRKGEKDELSIDNKSYISPKPKMAVSTVMSRRNVGILWQTYELNEYEKHVTYREYIVMDANNRMITMYFEIKNEDSANELEYNGADNQVYKIGKKATRCFKTIFTLFDRRVHVDPKETFPTFPINIDEYLKLKHVPESNAFVLYENEHPVIATQYNNPKEQSTISIPLFGKDVPFTFNSKHNQYIVGSPAQ